MSWYKIAQQTFQDWFRDEIAKAPNPVKYDPAQVKTTTLTLYRGFDADLNLLKRSGDNYILSPEKSEQGVLWFSTKLSVAQGRGEYILEYPLSVKKHYQTVHYSDGSTSEFVPQEIQAKSEPTENCPFWNGYELPDDWFFSYKVEKHIICAKPLIVSPNMIKKDESYELV